MTMKLFPLFDKQTRNILKKPGWNIAYRTDNSLSRLINKKKSNQDKYNNNSGVYKLNCTECSQYYIGQTRSTFKTTFKEDRPKGTTTQTDLHFPNT